MRLRLLFGIFLWLWGGSLLLAQRWSFSAFQRAKGQAEALEKTLTRRYPEREHLDAIHLEVTYLSPQLMRAEARAWAKKMDLDLRHAKARLAKVFHPRELTFRVRFQNRVWTRLDQRIRTALEGVELEIDGDFFSVARVERPCFEDIGAGQAICISFRTPPGEPTLPGPSAQRIRLWFPGLENRRRLGARRKAKKDFDFVPRVAFEPELFADRWDQPNPKRIVGLEIP